MSEEMIERHQGDEMIRLTLMDGQVRVMMCETTQMAQRAADIHGATPVCTAAMGRLMTATSMLGVMMKGENESVTVNIHGDGPMGTIVAVANHGDVKVCADDARGWQTRRRRSNRAYRAHDRYQRLGAERAVCRHD